MVITIVGGGNVGTQFAVHCASKGHRVTVYTTRPERFDRKLQIVGEDGREILNGAIAMATDDESQAFSSTDVVFVTVPAFCMGDIAAKMEPYIRKGMYIGLVPGTGGGECAFARCVDRGAVVFGLQRVPSVARLCEYGKSVFANGYRGTLHVASIPGNETGYCADLVSDLFDIECVRLPGYLNVTLTPSNPILHTSRLKVLFGDYVEGTVYERVPLFYEEWDDASSELLLSCDEEVQGICTALPECDLSAVVSLRRHYESETVRAMSEKIRSIQSLKGLKAPAVAFGVGWIPDFTSRYFTADFPYGLSILVQVAGLVGAESGTLEGVLDWYRRVSGNVGGFDYRRYGICNREGLIEFYSR